MLALPKSRPSLLQSLSEAGDLYENPDTPETTYSFQEPVPSKSSMNTDSSHHLSAPVLDAHILITTDDEMIDSDNDQRRDEDFDIDLDAEVYSVSGDLEMNLSPEEDSAAYGHMDENDNDDIMLDDEPTEYHSEHPDISPVPEQSPLNQAENFDSVVTESAHVLEREDYSGSVSYEQSNGATDTAVDESSAISRLHHEETNQVILEHTDHNQVSPIESQGALPNENVLAVGQEDNDGCQSSTATLGHEGVENRDFLQSTKEAENQTDEHLKTTDDDSVQDEGLVDPSYQYPIIVQYEHNQLTLFPSLTDWSEDPVMADVYRDLPSDYLLPDVSVCERSFEELFMHLRDVLGPSVGPGSELIFEIPLLGLRIGEDSKGCRLISLRRILDQHNQLYENDGYQIALPVSVRLETIPRFCSQLDEISAAVQQKKGLQECLSLLSLQPVDDYSHENEPTEDFHKNELPQNDIFPKGELSGHVDEHQNSPEALKEDLLGETTNSPSKEPVFSSEMSDNGKPKTNTDDQLSPVQNVSEKASDSSILSASDSDGQSDVDRKQDVEEELLEYDDEYDRLQPEETKYEDAPPYESNIENINGHQEGGYNELNSFHLIETSIMPSGANYDNNQEHPTTAADIPSENADPSSSRSDIGESKPSSIPVFDGDEGPNDYDNLQQGFDEYEYGHESTQEDHYSDIGHSEQVPDEQYSNLEQGYVLDQPDIGENENYKEVPLIVDDYVTEGNGYAEIDPQENANDESINYPADYVEHDTNYIDGTEELQETEFEGYDETAHFEEAGFKSLDNPEANDRNHPNPINSATRSPDFSIQDEELIGYDEDEEIQHKGDGDEGDENVSQQLHKSTSDISLNTHKRLREQSDEASDSKFDENQASKRSRAE